MRTRQTIIFVTLVIILSAFGRDIITWFRGASASHLTAPKKEISSKHAMFFGHWSGSSGTIIDIRSDGTADFIDRNSQLRSARLRINGSRLIISLPGFQKALIINDSPRLGHDGLWRMRLDGELFIRDSRDILVGISVIRPQHEA